MKELLVTMGLIILGGIIVSTLVLGGEGTLQGAAEGIVGDGIEAVTKVADLAVYE